jgi:hypothetical protein
MIAKFAPMFSLFFLKHMLNLPFGFLRGRVRRVYSPVDFRYFHLFILAAILGQFLGGKVEI